MGRFDSDVENLCIAFANRNNLKFEKAPSEYGDLIITFPKQEQLNFPLELSINDDEFHISYEGLWTYIFPFEQKTAWINELLDGIVTGDCRLTNYYQFGILKKSVLQHYKNGAWKHAYTANHKLKIPFIKTTKTIIRNQIKTHKAAS